MCIRDSHWSYKSAYGMLWKYSRAYGMSLIIDPELGLDIVQACVDVAPLLRHLGLPTASSSIPSDWILTWILTAEQHAKLIKFGMR